MGKILITLKAKLRSRVQRLLVGVFDFWYRRRSGHLPRVSWVLGPNEIATMAAQLAASLPDSFTMLRIAHPFYSDQYDYCPPVHESRIARLRRSWITEPALFVRLANSADGFIYLSQLGHLSMLNDDRRFEFEFLRKHEVKVVSYFTGNDIRSVKLMREHETQTGMPNLASYLPYVNPVYGSSAYEDARKRLGLVVSELADEIFTMSVDQRGHIDRETRPFQYIIADDMVRGDLSRHEDVQRPVLLHAPSSPVVKGTQLVRAAVEALKREGFDFEYVELTRVPHDQVMEQLQRAHVVLNQFYAHAPGVFAVEAMAAGCAVMTSADEEMEPDLPVGSNQAWVVTRHWEVYHNLRRLLENPGALREQAIAGQEWVRRHAVASVSGAAVREVLDGLVSKGEGERHPN